MAGEEQQLACLLSRFGRPALELGAESTQSVRVLDDGAHLIAAVVLWVPERRPLSPLRRRGGDAPHSVRIVALTVADTQCNRGLEQYLIYRAAREFSQYRSLAIRLDAWPDAENLLPGLGFTVRAGDEGRSRAGAPWSVWPNVMTFAAGIGWDIHPMLSGLPLVLGGVKVESEAGLQGHSDGDALTHAIIDACYGAAGLGDIGAHYPDTAAEYKGVLSLDLLQDTIKNLRLHGVFPTHVDCIVQTSIKLGTYREAMRASLENAIGCGVSLKFKSGNGMTVESRGEAISAQSVVTTESFTR
jgi:2-C-methyl-D-erythritol 2,4-cyclodiphosphate synthase